jgi:2-hydroxychromene-2-carboxylate isomerase
MTTSIEIFYSFQSPYSYLALDGIYELQKEFGVELLWQPFSAKASGQPPVQSPLIPEKLSYVFEDTKRYAAEHSIPLTFPESWPENEYDPGRITRGALVAADLDVLLEYNYKVFHKCWGLGENPNDEHFMSELCDELDIDLGDFLSKVSSSDCRERVKGVYKRGRKLGVFDTPTFIMDGERFVGIDKLQYLRNRLRRLPSAPALAAQGVR